MVLKTRIRTIFSKLEVKMG